MSTVLGNLKNSADAEETDFPEEAHIQLSIIISCKIEFHSNTSN